MPLFPELTARSLDELLRAFDAGPGLNDDIPEEEVPLWLEEVAVQIAEKGEPGLDALLQRSLRSCGEVRLRAILLALSFLPAKVREARRADLERVLSMLLGAPPPSIIAAAVDALSDLGSEKAAERIRPLLNHASPEVVASALRYLARQKPAEATPVLLQALESPEPLIRENAVDELDDMECVAALPQLRHLLNDADADVRQAAHTAVSNLEEIAKAR